MLPVEEVKAVDHTKALRIKSPRSLQTVRISINLLDLNVEPLLKRNLLDRE